MNPAQQLVIARFGGQTALAEAVHTKQSTVQYWSKTGKIPAKWHKPIVEGALRRGISISANDFVSGSTWPPI